jgi:hypothetical protein
MGKIEHNLKFHFFKKRKRKRKKENMTTKKKKKEKEKETCQRLLGGQLMGKMKQTQESRQNGICFCKLKN